MSQRQPRTIVDKILDASTIREEGGRSLVYVDRLIAADTAMPAFNNLRKGGYRVRRPKQAWLIPDHYTPSAGPTLQHVSDEEKRVLIRDSMATAKAAGMHVIALDDPTRGIQHTVSTEQGYAQPGVVIAAADSHTATQGAVGALGFSIGTDLAHVMATQCIWLKRPRQMRVLLSGSLSQGVTTKDVALQLVATVGSTGANGHAVEFAGPFTSTLSVEGRMTLCNMAIEMGARTAIVAPDDITFGYLRSRPLAPSEAHWNRAQRCWISLRSDEGAKFDREIRLDVGSVQPMVTWGNNTETAVPIDEAVPDAAVEADPVRRQQMLDAFAYMGLRPGTPLAGLPVDQVFIGSCTNSTLPDLRAAARLLRGRSVSVPTLVVPGSGLVKAQAEAEGLAEIFKSAGAEWVEPGCSMCSAMNGDAVPPGARCASTANRNHIGRQGPGSRTHLVSPPMAAAAAVGGCLVDVRTVEGL